jgi:hypothetical protein
MSSYSSYMKNGTAMTALRAVGFAVEKAFKESSKVGFGMVAKHHVEKIVLSGDVKMKRGGSFVEFKDPLTITLADVDSDLALSVFKEDLKLLEDLGLNVWAVDRKIPSIAGSHDLVAAFKSQDRLVDGLVSVELKTMSVQAGPSALRQKQTACKKRFAEMSELQSQNAYHAVVLMISRVGKIAGRWTQPRVEAHLWDGGEWKVLKGRPRPLFFAQLRRQRKIAAILRSLEWFPREQGAPVAKVADFLKALKKDTHNVGEKV